MRGCLHPPTILGDLNWLQAHVFCKDESPSFFQIETLKFSKNEARPFSSNEKCNLKCIFEKTGYQDTYNVVDKDWVT